MSQERAPGSPPSGHAPTVSDLLTQARSAGVDRLDAQLLLGRVLQQSRAWLIAHDDHPLDTTPGASPWPTCWGSASSTVSCCT
jgi:hypothetical protein